MWIYIRLECVCVVDKRVVFCACKCGSVLSTTYVYMTPPPRHLEGVSAGSIGCMRVAVYDVVSPGFSCAFEYCAVYGVWGSHGSAAMFTNGFPKTSVEIW